MKKLITILAASACVLAACNKENPEKKKEPINYSGTLESMTVETKTSLQAGNSVVWNDGDEVKIFEGLSTGNRYRISSSALGKSSGALEIVGTAVEGNAAFDHAVAVYPYDSDIKCDGVTGSSVYTLKNVNIPATQTYVENSFGPSSNPMVSVAGMSLSTSLNFKNVCGAVQINVKGDVTISSISLRGLGDEPLAGKAEISMSVGGEPTVSLLGSSSKTVSMNLGSTGVALTHDQVRSFYLTIPPTSFADGIEVILKTANGKNKTCRFTAPCDVRRSVIAEMPLIEFYTPKDLSVDGSANSYIVSEAGYYSFRAVKGNSTESVGEVASVEVLWETFGTDTAPKVGDLVNNVAYADGNIEFIATEKKGNALIVAKDAEGKILWSWHIWMTDKPEDHVYYNNAGTMMDRNLGATSAEPGKVETLGLLYQWGRKDPFLGASSISSSTRARSTTNWSTSDFKDNSHRTIAYAQENPTAFILFSQSNFDWYYTGSSEVDNTRWQSEKTIYDPCPPGYRVTDGGENVILSKALN